MGTVKDLVVIKEAKEKEVGEGIFVFTDHFSVFDYGRMPDLIEGKGHALCLISAYFFEKLNEKGINNHYISLIEDGKSKFVDELEKPTNKMKIKLFRVIKPKKVGNGYDYSIYKKLPGNFLIPLEVIYRNYLPEGSSIFKRLKEGKITLQALGLKEYPMPGQKLERPVIDVSTKLETVDRYLTWDEAMEISGLNKDEMDCIKKIALKISNIITLEVEKAEIINEDGKFEFALDDKRKIIVVDAIGTPDECRFSFDGFPLSKEIIRMYYRRTEWYKEFEKKKMVEELKNVSRPPNLPSEFKSLVSKMYKSFCNEIVGRRFFEVPKIKQVVKELKKYMGR